VSHRKMVAANIRVTEAARKRGAVAAATFSWKVWLQSLLSSALFYSRVGAIQLNDLVSTIIVWLFLNNLSSARRGAYLRDLPRLVETISSVRVPLRRLQYLTQVSTVHVCVCRAR
jgi:hypothetical protein